MSALDDYIEPDESQRESAGTEVVPELSGHRIFMGTYCQYGDIIKPADLVEADFDRKTIANGGGLFLVEIVEDGRVTWMGCRALSYRPDGVAVDTNGRGEWETFPSLEATGYRIAGMVKNVYRATSLC